MRIWPRSLTQWIRDTLTINPGRHPAATGAFGPSDPAADPEPAGPPCGDENRLPGAVLGHGGRQHVCLCTEVAGHPADGRTSDAWHRCGQAGGCGAVWASQTLQAPPR